MAEFESIWSDLQGVAFSQGYLDAGGVRTRYLRAGDPGKPVLVLLHGSCGHADAMRGFSCSIAPPLSPMRTW